MIFSKTTKERDGDDVFSTSSTISGSGSSSSASAKATTSLPPLSESKATVKPFQFLDSVRIILLVFVIFCHSSEFIIEGWRDKALSVILEDPNHPSDLVSFYYVLVCSLFFTILILPSFFFISGFFTPKSFARRDNNVWKFLKDRTRRLLFPLAVNDLIIGPVLMYAVSVAKKEGKGFWQVYGEKYNVGSSVGWFLALLFLFNVVYAIFRLVIPIPKSTSNYFVNSLHYRSHANFPFLLLLLTVLVLSCITFALKLVPMELIQKLRVFNLPWLALHMFAFSLGCLVGPSGNDDRAEKEEPSVAGINYDDESRLVEWLDVDSEDEPQNEDSKPGKCINHHQALQQPSPPSKSFALIVFFASLVFIAAKSVASIYLIQVPDLSFNSQYYGQTNWQSLVLCIFDVLTMLTLNPALFLLVWAFQEKLRIPPWISHNAMLVYIIHPLVLGGIGGSLFIFVGKETLMSWSMWLKSMTLFVVGTILSWLSAAGLSLLFKFVGRRLRSNK